MAEKELEIEFTSSIASICVLFYSIVEIFDIIGNGMELSADGKIITRGEDDKVYNWINCSYGINAVPSMNKGVYKWVLKMHKVTGGGVRVGLSSTTVQQSCFYANNDIVGINYIYWNGSGHSYKYLKEARWGCENYGRRYDADDMVSIILDLNQRQISFAINDEDQGVAYKDIQVGEDIHYRMFVSLYFVHDSVEIVSFSQA